MEILNRKTIIFCLGLLISLLLGCKNRPDISLTEPALTDMVRTDSIRIEKTIAEFDFSADSTRVHFKQKQNIQGNSHAKLIDLTVSPKIVKELKLSEIGGKIEYIKFKPEDTSYFYIPETNFQFYKNHVITHNLKGTEVYDLNGNHVDYIVKNEIKIGFTGNGGFYFTYDGFSGMFNPPVIYGDKLYYIYKDKNSNRGALCRFYLDKLSDIKVSNNLEIENTVKGEPLISIKGGFIDGINQVQVLDDNTWLGVNAFWTSFKENVLMHSFSMEGDTTTTFKNNDPVFGFKDQNYRMPEDKSLYKLNGKLMYRQAYNDTMYRILSANEMKPEYILYRGDKGLSTREGMSPRVNLAGKIIIDQVYETNNWLLLVTSNNHNCPNTRKKNEVQFSYWLYNKLSGELIKRKGEFKDEHEGLLNDLDNGMSFWPKQASPEGWLLNGYLVKELRKKYSDKELKEKFPFEEFNNDEYILMIVK